MSEHNFDRIRNNYTRKENEMKKIIALLLVLVLSLALCACNNKIEDDDDDDDKPRRDPIVTKAVDKLEEHWRELYSESDYGSGYFEIKNTRLIKIKENDKEPFKDIRYIVDFMLFTDIYGSAPFYQNTVRESSIVIYKDGTMQVANNDIITHYIATTADFDVARFFESIDDFDDAYNRVKWLK